MALVELARHVKDNEACGEKSELPIANEEDASPQQQEHPEAHVARTKSRVSSTLARVASRVTTCSSRDPGPPPDGGVLAWTQIFCAWLAILNTWGFVNSFGAFQPYYESIIPESASTISWIGSTQACLLFALGLFSGRALDRGWFRPTIVIGIVIQILGIFALSGATTYWQFLLTQGFCTGVGGGIFFVPIMVRLPALRPF
jgi:fucose permease